MRITDRDIGSYFDSTFRNSRNPHKYALLWASNFYKHINFIMRTIPLDQQLLYYPNVVHFIQKFVQYFYSHGVNKQNLATIKKRLHRGMNIAANDMPNTESGFMSTSFSKSIARSFARDDGVILTITIDTLPENVPFVIIDERLADYLHESEVLFLPGFIRTEFKNSKNYLKYTMDENRINAYRDVVTNRQYGGKGESKGKKHEQSERALSLSGRFIVYYRAILNRPVEVFSWTQLPKDESKIEATWKKKVVASEHFYEKSLSVIPEWTSNQKRIFDMKCPHDECRDILRLQASYKVYTAVYNPYTHTVESTHYGMVDFIKSEMQIDCSESRCQEIRDAILKAYTWTQKKTD